MEASSTSTADPSSLSRTYALVMHTLLCIYKLGKNGRRPHKCVYVCGRLDLILFRSDSL